jgi:hypothetical protein
VSSVSLIGTGTSVQQGNMVRARRTHQIWSSPASQVSWVAVQRAEHAHASTFSAASSVSGSPPRRRRSRTARPRRPSPFPERARERLGADDGLANGRATGSCGSPRRISCTIEKNVVPSESRVSKMCSTALNTLITSPGTRRDVPVVGPRRYNKVVGVLYVEDAELAEHIGSADVDARALPVHFRVGSFGEQLGLDGVRTLGRMMSALFQFLERDVA